MIINEISIVNNLHSKLIFCLAFPNIKMRIPAATAEDIHLNQQYHDEFSIGSCRIYDFNSIHKRRDQIQSSFWKVQTAQ